MWMVELVCCLGEVGSLVIVFDIVFFEVDCMFLLCIVEVLCGESDVWFIDMLCCLLDNDVCFVEIIVGLLVVSGFFFM